MPKELWARIRRPQDTCVGYLLLWACMLHMGGCGRAALPILSPKTVVGQYAAYIQAGQPGDALELISARTRKQLDQKSFERFIQAGDKRLKELLAQLTNAGSVEMELTATLKTPEGAEVLLIKQGGVWKLDAGDVIPGSGLSPQAVVEEFLRAIDRRDCQALLACAPPKVRAGQPIQRLLEGCKERMESLQQIAKRIQSNRIKPVMISKERAELTYHQNRKLILVRYEGRWYLEDL